MINITLLSQLRSVEMVDHRNLKSSTSSMASPLIIKSSAEILFLRSTTTSWFVHMVSCIIFSLHQVTRWPPSGGTTLIVVDTSCCWMMYQLHYPNGFVRRDAIAWEESKKNTREDTTLRWPCTQLQYIGEAIIDSNSMVRSKRKSRIQK